jgi:uncharacterized SAM-binding protein YcdF (DUF218 family)
MRQHLKFVGLATAVIVILIVAWITVDVYRFSEKDETRPADAAIVLGAAVHRGRPSPIFQERINHAIQLYQAGLVEKIIFPGGVGFRDELSEGEVGRQYALARGIPAEDILIEITSTSTQENLANAKMVAEQNGLHSFLIVSTPYHMKRALALAADLEMEAYSSPTRSIRWINRYTRSRAYGREVAAYMAYLVGLGN